MAGDTARWLELGSVGKPHGLRGAFFVSGRSDPVPSDMKSVMFGPDPATGRVCRLAGVSVQQGRPVMALADFPDRTAIEAVRGTKLWIQRSEIKIDESSEYLWSDVIGSEVFDAAGQRMGLVVEMANYGASDIAVIEAESGARLDLPFVGVYVDMSFRGADKRISLLVESAVFADLWSKN